MTAPPPELEDLQVWLRQYAQPRGRIEAHFLVTELKRQWMTDGTFIIWMPLNYLAILKPHFDTEAPPTGMAGSLRMAAYLGTPVCVSDPFSGMARPPFTEPVNYKIDYRRLLNA